MTQHAGRLVGALTLLVASVACGQSRDQDGAAAAGTPSTNMGTLANTYVNTYANPLLNPYAMQQRTSLGNAALLYSAQSAKGGTGSGQLSGVRPGFRTPGQRQAAPRPPEDARYQFGVPSSVARYFQRGPQKPAAASFYNRSVRYYSSSSRL